MNFTPSQDLSGRIIEYPGGIVIRAENPDGSEITPQRILGTNKPVNLLSIYNNDTIVDSATKKAILIITSAKPDGNPASKRVVPVDFSGAADIEQVTPSEIVAALGSVASDIITAEIDAATGRVKIAAVTAAGLIYLSVSGPLAGALGFGDGLPWRSFGTPFFESYSYDDTITATPTATRSDDQDITLAGGSLGRTGTVTIPGELSGYSIALANRSANELLDQAINGEALSYGDTLDVNIKGTPALPSEVITQSGLGRRFTVWHIIKLYTQDMKSNVKNMKGLSVYKYNNCSIVQSDDGVGALSHTTKNYTITAPATYLDKDGVERPNKVHDFYATDSEKINNFDAFVSIANLDSSLRLSSIRVVTITSATPERTTISMSSGQVERNVFDFTDDTGAAVSNPSGVMVSFGTLSVLTNTVLTWNYDKDRVEISAGATAGTEVVSVVFTNVDGSVVNASFSLTVSA